MNEWLDGPTPRVLAHRGLARDAIENTLPAFHAAVAAGAGYLESDIHATSDSIAVLFHDDTLERDFGVAARIEELTAAELRRLTDARAHIPTLEEAITSLPGVRWNLDVKTRQAIGPTIATLRRSGARDRVLIASFSGSRSAGVARAFPGIARSPGVLRMALVLCCARLGLVRLGRALLGGFTALQIPRVMAGVTLVSPALVRRYRRMGVEVHVWTVNEEEEMRELIAMGVDGLVTDRADRAVAVIGRP